MKFVYFGYDFMLGSILRLIKDGHELIGVFTFECDNVFNFNTQTIALAQDKSIPVITSKPQDIHLEKFISDGCECFLSAGYPHKIPPFDESIAQGINFHPSLLPKGRGIMPTPHIIINHPEASGISVHKLTQNFDGGDILYQKPLALNEGETVETLSARIAMCAPDILSMIMADLPAYLNEATPQDQSQASNFMPPDDQMRTLDWNLPVHAIDRIARAFGRYGSLAHFDDQTWVVYDLDVWEEEHNLPFGEIICNLGRQTTIAAKDGFVCLKDFQPAQM